MKHVSVPMPIYAPAIPLPPGLVKGPERDLTGKTQQIAFVENGNDVILTSFVWLFLAQNA
jgi:hypothetical protein